MALLAEEQTTNTKELRRLAILSTHPIQYNAPLFRLLQTRGNIAVRVYYTWGEEVLRDKYDPDFKKIIEWDIPLLDGYDYQFVSNTATEKGSHHFKGIVNPDLIRQVDGFKPDAILIFGWSFQSHLHAMRHYKGKIPVIFRGDSTLLDERPGIKSMIRNLFLRFVYRHIDKALYTGIENKKYFLKAGIKEENLVFGPHAVDNIFFSDPQGIHQQLAESLREKLGIDKEVFVFLFAGKFEGKKSPLLLINAFRSAKFGRKVGLVLVGNGALEKEMKDLAANENIYFMDFANQRMMPAVYRMGDVFVLPSGGPGETWGLALNEAMACGKPVIASSKCGAAADLIPQNSTGIVFAAANGQSLREALERMQTDAAGRLKMAEAALERIKQFSLTRLAESIERILLN